jgi:hypothetical protein
MSNRTTVTTIVFLAAVSWTGAAERYVSPKGTPKGAGTRESPWDIESALAGKHKVQAGDTIYLLGGTYRRRPDEKFMVKLAGAEGKPLHVKPAPNERVIVDGGLHVADPSAHLWIWDLEIIVSEPQPTKPVSAGSFPADFKRPWGGLHLYGGKHCKYIGLVIHECRQGISAWAGSTNSEIHGCILYDNGWPAVDRGHGHAIYTQNKEGINTISDCIFTGGHGYTMHAYGSANAYVDNYLVEGNIAYNANTFLIGGGRPSKNIRVRNNYLYGVSMQIGYAAKYNEDCEVKDNLVVNGVLSINKYKKAVDEGNLILAKNAARSKESRIVLRPNKYDKARANLAIFKWDDQAAILVDPSAFLKKGDTYRLMNPRDFFGKAVLTGTFDGKPVRVPIAGEFTALVMLKKA